MPFSGLRRRLASQTTGLPWLILGSGLLVTALISLAVHRGERVERQRRALQLAEQVGASLDSRLESTIAILSATAGLFQASEQVSRDEFRRFFQALDLSSETLRGIQGVGFATVVPSGAERGGFLSRIRADGLPDFRLWPDRSDPRASGTERTERATPAEPALTSSIIYLQPENWRNRRSYGFNMYSEPTRRAAMAMAALTGRPSLSGPVRLVQEAGSEVQAGTLVYVPVHRDGLAGPDDGAGRLAALIGWAYAPLRMGNLLTASLARIDSADLHGARVLLYDGHDRRPGSLLADNRHHDPQAPPPDTVWVNRAMVDREWLIGVDLPAAHLAVPGLTPTLLLTGLAGSLASTVAALAAGLLIGNHRATVAALEQARKASEERALAAAVFETSPVGMIVTDPDGVVQATNIAFAQISGWSQREALGHKANLLRSGRHDEAFYRNLWESIIQRGYWSGEIWNRHRNGQIRRHDLSITAVLNAQQQITHFIGMLRDVTDRHAEQEKVRFQALHDYLTGLPNRALLIDELQRSLALAQRRGGRVALLFMDLDGFKAVNDAHGHQIGDALLKAVAERLLQGIRASDRLCRQGGDEFVLLIGDTGTDEDLQQLARKLMAAVARPFAELPDDIRIGMSVGIACWPEHARDADGLFGAADAAMYAAKRSRGERLCMARLLSPQERGRPD